MTTRHPLRAATALATGLALALPPLPAFAQDATPEELRAQCVEGGVPEGEEALDLCVAAFLAGEDGVAAATATPPAEVEAAAEDAQAAEPEVETTDAPVADEALEETVDEALAESDEVQPAEDVATQAVEGDDTQSVDDAAVATEGRTGTQASQDTDAAFEEVAPLDEPVVVQNADPATALSEGEGTDTATEAPVEEPVEPVADEAVAEDATAEDAAAEEAIAEDTTVQPEATPEATTVDAAGDPDPLACELAAQQGQTLDGCPPVEDDGAADTAEAEQPADAAEEAPTADAPIAAEDPLGDAVDQTADATRDVIPDTTIDESVETLDAADLSEEERTAVENTGNAIGDLLRDFTGEQATTETTAAAAASGDAEPTGEVVEATIAEDEVRTADQDFATQAIVTERRGDDGTNDRERFAIGLAGLAVGALLGNQARVVSNSGDRVIVQRQDGDLALLKDDDVLLRQAGTDVRTENFDDGSSRTIVTRPDGSQVITVRDASLRVLRRVVRQPDGTETTLIDDTVAAEPVEVSTLPEFRPTVSTRTGDPLAEALARNAGLDRRFSLAQVRQIPEVRALAPAFEVDTVTFETGSAAIQADQADELTDLADVMLRTIRENPRAVFLVEGHTDATGDAALNLALSDRRAESLALALNQYFQVPVENMVVQGYGERFLKVPTQTAERANRRAVAREITGLLQTAAAN